MEASASASAARDNGTLSHLTHEEVSLLLMLLETSCKPGRKSRRGGSNPIPLCRYITPCNNVDNYDDSHVLCTCSQLLPTAVVSLKFKPIKSDYSHASRRLSVIYKVFRFVVAGAVHSHECNQPAPVIYFYMRLEGYHARTSRNAFVFCTFISFCFKLTLSDLSSTAFTIFSSSEQNQGK